MAKKALPLRIDQDLLKRVDDRRRELGQTRTLFVERALEAALAGARVVPSRAEVLETVRSLQTPDLGRPIQASDLEVPGAVVRASGIVMRFRCPDAQCPRRFGSGAAVCPDHGRKAVE